MKSIWRKSHFLLAIISSIFLIALSITGILLSIEATNRTSHDWNISNAPKTCLANILDAQKEKEIELISIEKTEYGFLTVEYLDFNGDVFKGTINPTTGKIHPAIEKKPFFDFVRSFHRSLLLGKTGRLIVGIVAFLLILISISGVILIANRQLTLKRFFGKIHFDNWFSFGHVLSGRWGLFIILTIAISGAYLSMQRFEIIKNETSKEHDVQSIVFNETEQISWSEFDIFKNTPLTELEQLSFPFSPFPDDYFILKTNTKSQIINQFDGSVLDEINKNPTNPFLKNIHTGANYFWWNFILILGAISILFFIFTGFKIFLSRRQKSLSNNISKDEAEILIYFGSETNNTLSFAQFLSDEIQKNGKKVFLDVLNNFSEMARENKTILFLTSTYGNGEAPKNANNFMSKIEKIPQETSFNYSVLGFGSKDYPLFCNFAKSTNEKIASFSNTTPIIEYSTVNNQSVDDINIWIKNLESALKIKITPYEIKRKKIKQFKIENHSNEISPQLDNFWVSIETKTDFQSGDLLAIIPKKGERERYYSIAKWNNKILIGVKKHEFGICSNYLSELNKNDKINGWIQKNNHFHCPKNDVIFIANGTGAIPFLGMINERNQSLKSTLFWGLKNDENFELYSDKINQLVEQKKLHRIEKIYSQAKNGAHIQKLVEQNETLFRSHLKKGGYVMICGSSEMEKDIRQWIDSLTISNLTESQILADTY